MEGSVAEAKQAIEAAIQLSSQTDSGLLSQILEKVSYIELRMDSAESKATDMLRHLSQHLSEFSLSMAQGDVSILRGWILSLKSGFLKSVLSLGISEDQAVEAFQVLIKMTEEKVKLETENDEMFSLSVCISGYAEKSNQLKNQHEQSYAESIQQTEMALRNMRLPVWRAETLQMELAEWKPRKGFSVYLQTQILQAEAMLSKAKALRVRLTDEMAGMKAKHQVLAAVFEKIRAKVAAEFMEEETEAEKKGMEVEAKI